VSFERDNVLQPDVLILLHASLIAEATTLTFYTGTVSKHKLGKISPRWHIHKIKYTYIVRNGKFEISFRS